MPWCENKNCGKDNLRKEDIEFDQETHMVLCHGCMTLVHPGWVPPNEYVDLSGVIPHTIRKPFDPKFGMALQINEQDGLKAAFSYGGLALTLQVPIDDYQRLFGPI
jgi:hypothetical protein